ncbi:MULTISPECIES: LuxR C-terminal-related transcriptional regulator [unclassified Sinorhizobium]|uniref:LuxR C-terminal-related transcriptional regulator n=1 Tax=unclassified Sinorhizobium TaxID=2613772 RepID=UPI003523F0BC
MIETNRERKGNTFHTRIQNTSTAKQLPYHSDTLVIVIGASEDGLEACRVFFNSLSDETGIAVIVVQSGNSLGTAVTTQMLASFTRLIVIEAEDGMTIKAGNLYLVPFGMLFSVKGGVLHLSSSKGEAEPQRPLNVVPHDQRAGALDQLSRLTTRQRQILDRVIAGQSSKVIAAELGISQRTVENHRASIMKRTGSRSLPALLRLVLAASE